MLSIFYTHAQVSITPEVTSRSVNRAVMEQLVRQYRESYLGGRLPAYDGRKSLYTAGPLPFSSREFEILLVEEDDGSGAERLYCRDLSFILEKNTYMIRKIGVHEISLCSSGGLRYLKLLLSWLPVWIFVT